MHLCVVQINLWWKGSQGNLSLGPKDYEKRRNVTQLSIKFEKLKIHMYGDDQTEYGNSILKGQEWILGRGSQQVFKLLFPFLFLTAKSHVHGIIHLVRG